MPVKKSVYETPETWRDDIKNTGFDYEGKILKKTMSNQLFKDPTRAGILEYLEKVVFELVESVKKIKTFADYRKKKSYRKFN